MVLLVFVGWIAFAIRRYRVREPWTAEYRRWVNAGLIGWLFFPLNFEFQHLPWQFPALMSQIQGHYFATWATAQRIGALMACVALMTSVISLARCRILEASGRKFVTPAPVLPSVAIDPGTWPPPPSTRP